LFQETSIPRKIQENSRPKNIRRKNFTKQNLCKDILRLFRAEETFSSAIWFKRPFYSREIIYHDFFQETPYQKIFLSKILPKKYQKRNFYQTNSLHRQSAPFALKRHSLAQFL